MKQTRHTAIVTLSIQYSLYFGVMGIFLPYFNLYCHHLGFTGGQIGAMSSAKSLTLAVFPILWGRLADRFQIRKTVYIACNITSVLLWMLLLFTDRFPAMLAIMFFYGLFHAPIISFLEAFTMDALASERNRYGMVRVWGTLAFIGVVLGIGKLIDMFSASIAVALILGGSAVQALFAFTVPDRAAARPPGLPKANALKDRRVLMFLGCAFIMLASHGMYYGFFSIHLEQLGCGSVFIGAAWALAAISEITVMVCSKKIFSKFHVKHVIFFSFMAAGLRWTILFFAESPGIILGTQLLHALTYGAFHISSILYMDHLMPAGSKTTGQAANNAVTYGFGMMAGFFTSGYLYDIVGPFVLFGMSGLLALAGGLLFWRFVIRKSAST